MYTNSANTYIDTLAKISKKQPKYWLFKKKENFGGKEGRNAGISKFFQENIFNVEESLLEIVAFHYFYRESFFRIAVFRGPRISGEIIAFTLFSAGEADAC